MKESNGLPLLKEIAAEGDKMDSRLHCRIRAIEDALKRLGITQEFLTDRYHEHMRSRKVRDEELVGPQAAAEMWGGEYDPIMSGMEPEGS